MSDIAAALEKVDLSQVTEDQVILDIIEQSRQFAVRMSVASAVLDLLRRDKGDGVETVVNDSVVS